jgi:acetyltransferase-like isoleucine patch superfamily enzyme
VRGVRRAGIEVQNALFRARYARHLGPSTRIFGWPIIDLYAGSTIQVGERLWLISKPRYNAVGVAHPCILRTLSPGARISIGDDVGLSGCTICAAERIELGDKVMLGANVTVIDSDLHPTGSGVRRHEEISATRPVSIGDNVLVGMNAVILKGVTIGANSVIGAGSVVTHDIPPDSVAAGVPATVVASVDDGHD